MRGIFPGLIIALALPRTLCAHGDHGAPKVLRPADPGLRIAAAATERFEVVIKYRAGPLGTPVPARLYLSDAETNAPVAGAKVMFEIPDQSIKIIASPDRSAGLYSLGLLATKAGKFDGLIDIDPGADGDEDLIPVANLELGPLRIDLPRTVWRMSWQQIVAVLTALLAVLSAGILRSRRERRAMVPQSGGGIP